VTQSKAVLEACVGLVLALCAATPASANLVINLTYDSSFATQFGSNTGAAQSAIGYAAQQFEDLYSDPIHVNITIAGVAGTGTLGESDTFLDSFSYTSIRNALIVDARSSDDLTAVGPGGSVVPIDPVTGTHSWWTSTAQAKALGLMPDGLSMDGTITFGAGFSYTFDPANRTAGGKIDFIGVVEHEMSEIMGRIGLSGATVSQSMNAYALLDNFAYTGPGAKGLGFVANDFFSINNGNSLLKQFNSTAGADSRDWAGGSPDSFNAFVTVGAEEDITPVDVREMDVLGYDLAVPEPGTVLLFGGGLLVLLKRRGRKTPVFALRPHSEPRA